MQQKLCLATLFLAASCVTQKEPFDEPDLPIIPQKNKSLPASNYRYIISQGKTEKAIDALLASKNEDPYTFHQGALAELGLQLLEQGVTSRNPQDIYTSLYGIGICRDDRTLKLIEHAMQYDEPQLQMLSINVLASFDTDEATHMLEEAMKSDYIFVRLEAAYWLAQKRTKSAHGQLLSLMSKVDPELYELFPRLFALEGSQESLSELKRLLYDQNQAVRKEAILASAAYFRDDFISDLRLLAREPSVVQQEACAFALGACRDEDSRPTLETLAARSSPNVQVAALLSLYKLGSEDAVNKLLLKAQSGDIFAVSALGLIDGSEETLKMLLYNSDRDVRLNATIALVRRRSPAAVAAVSNILIDSAADYTFQPITSHGASLTAWKATASSAEVFRKHPQFFELSLRLREELLIYCMELPESDFLTICHTIFETQQLDLVPLTVRLIENIRSEQAIKLLKSEEQRLGAPYIRAWCCLGLLRLRQEGPYLESIRKMIEKHEEKEIFRARPVLPWRMRQDDNSQYQLTLEESCALVIESFQALAELQDEKGIEALLKAIKNGNEHNRYTLAGLLMRASL